MSLIFTTPHEMTEDLAKRAQAKRLALNLSQRLLAERSGVSYGVLKKFERTGKISLESLLKLALVLGALREFAELFKIDKITPLMTLDKLVKDKTRKRARP